MFQFPIAQHWIEHKKKQKHHDGKQPDGVGVALLFAFEKLYRHLARYKKLPGGTHKFPFQMNGVVPESPHEALHTDASVRVFLSTMCAILRLIGHWMVAIAAIPFQLWMSEWVNEWGFYEAAVDICGAKIVRCTGVFKNLCFLLGRPLPLKGSISEKSNIYLIINRLCT